MTRALKPARDARQSLLAQIHIAKKQASAVVEALKAMLNRAKEA